MFRKTAMAIALGVILGFAGQTDAGHHMKSESKKAAKIDHTMDIVDMAAHTGTFNTLVAAVKAAGLVETLKGEGPNLWGSGLRACPGQSRPGDREVSEQP